MAHARLFSNLRRVPGPFLASITPLWRGYHMLRGDWHTTIVELHERYGPHVRIAPNEISTTSIAAIRTTFSSSGSPWLKDSWYQTWWNHPTFHPLFSETDKQKHRVQRRRVSRVYSLSYILGMQSYIDPVLEDFFRQMRRRQGQAVNMTKWTQYFTYDVIGELGFGESFGDVANGEDWNDLSHWVHLTLSIHACLGWVYYGAKLVKLRPVRALLNQTILKRAGTEVTAFPLAQSIMRIKQKLKDSKISQRNDLVCHFQTMVNPDGTSVSPVEIGLEINSLVLAGADTTAISIRAFIFFVANNHRVYTKLQSEIDAAARSQQLSPLVTFQEASNLHYFQMVLKEALRLYPAVGYQLPRVVPQGGAIVDGMFLPGGSVLGVNAWALHRSRIVFGEDCAEFRPERWDEKDPEKLRTMEECFGTFGFGARTCLGKNLALMEMSRLLPTLFRDFNIEICYPQRPWILTTSWFTFSSKFYVRLRDRTAVESSE